MPGQSESAKRRRQLKEADPEKYSLMLERHNKRYQEAKRKREEYWASGTRQALDDKEAYYEKRRAVNRKSFHKSKVKASDEKRKTRTSAQASPVPESPRVSLKLLTPEERKAHDAVKRRQRKEKFSRQKRTADKAAHAHYMREWRMKKRESSTPHATPQLVDPFVPGPSGLQLALPMPAPIPGPSDPIDALQASPQVFNPAQIVTSTPLPSLKRNLACVDLHTAQQPRMRQHCYNTTSKMKAVLKSSFTSEESANMSANIILRKTPQKKKENLDRLLEHAEVRAYCKRKLVLEGNAATPVPNKYKSTKQRRRKNKSAQRLLEKTRSARHAIIKSEIQRFYKSPAVSRVLPHQRYATKWGAGHVMVMTLKAAHTAFESHNKKKVSFSRFAHLRPKNVRKLGSVPAETCLCVTCTNVRLKIDALNQLLGPEQAILPEGKMLKFLLCPYRGRWPLADCVAGQCLKCRDPIRPFTAKCFQHFFENTKWFHWERREVDGKKKLDIHSYHGTVCELLGQLNGDLQSPTKGTTFVQHLFTAYWQQSQYDLAKNNIRKGQVLLLQDFAENRKATYSQEVKSAHFGKAQVSLHPTVCFYKNDDEQLVRHVAMFFSDDIGHDYHAVHCYTKRMYDILCQETSVDEVILWSDGAASQYKGRGTFADLSLYPFSVQRNFFGSEHGKGEADGETGRFSQAMARAVASGKYFRNALDMVEFGAATYKSDAIRKYSFVHIPRDDIKRDRPETDVGTLPGTRSLHQLVRKGNYILAARKLSCFCSGCTESKFQFCVNQEHVTGFEIFKMKPSNPSLPNPGPSSSAEHQEEDEVEEEPIEQYTSSEIPQVGEWLQVIGTIITKKSRQDQTYYANVVSPPEDASTDFFYCQFFKRTPAGSYVLMPRTYQIVPGTEENYRWKKIPAPQPTSRGHYFFH